MDEYWETMNRETNKVKTHTSNKVIYKNKKGEEINVIDKMTKAMEIRKLIGSRYELNKKADAIRQQAINRKKKEKTEELEKAAENGDMNEIWSFIKRARNYGKKRSNKETCMKKVDDDGYTKDDDEIDKNWD